MQEESETIRLTLARWSGGQASGDLSISERERAAIRAVVQARAYAIWESENRPHGRDRAHWFQAKADLGIAEDAIVQQSVR